MSELVKMKESAITLYKVSRIKGISKTVTKSTFKTKSENIKYIPCVPLKRFPELPVYFGIDR